MQQNQQDALSNQQNMNQQMMLCPVRLVYETQILVQPGDQITPNQTLFVNQSNVPPWIQNRSLQNQVLYLPQLPANQIVHSIPQQIDQNQMYLQQSLGQYQQIMPNTFVTQPTQDQIRPIQYQVNMIPQNMQNLANIGQNMQANIGQNIPNYTQTNVGANMPNIVSTPNSVNDRQLVINNAGQTQIQQIVSSNNAARKPTEFQQPTNIPPQIVYQHTNIIRPQTVSQPQTMAINPVQYMQNISQVTDKNVSNTQSGIQNSQGNLTNNMTHIRTQKPMQVANTQTEPKKVVQSNITRPNLVNSIQTPRPYNMVYNPSFRAIQPRPQINYSQVGVQTQTQLPVQKYVQVSNIAPNVQRTPNTTVIAQKMSMTNVATNLPNHQSSNQRTPNYPFSNVPLTNQVDKSLNRKRKSESPDEVKKKIAITSVTSNMTLANPSQQIPLTTLSNNISTFNSAYTSPVSLEKKLNQNQMTATSGLTFDAQLITKPIVDHQVNNDIVKNVNIASEGKSQDTKLIRNTVFTQARGRLPNHKEIVPAVPTLPNPILTSHVNSTIVTEKPVLNKNSNIQENKLDEGSNLSENIEDKETKFIVEEKVIPQFEEETTKLVADLKTEEKATPIADIKTEEVLSKPFVNTEVVKEEKIQTPIKVEIKEQEVHLTDMKVHKQERDNYILTHVLDGYVIQESNIAFPIRKPLVERTINTHTTTEVADARDASDKSKEVIVDRSKILQLSTLNLSEDNYTGESDKDCNKNKDISPFTKIDIAAVKKWTIEDLTSHLSKYNWSETASILSEHEIDGESLFLVTSEQLVHIGISDEHAEAICEFVRK